MPKTKNGLIALVSLIFLACQPAAIEAEETLAPGPCLKKRTEVLNYIHKIEKQGIGVKPYTDALSRIEANVKSGQSEDEIAKQVSSLVSALTQQAQSFKTLKASGAVPARSAKGKSAIPQRELSTREMEEMLLDLVNKHRAEAGLRALRRSTKLTLLAQGHAQDMVKRDFFSHTNPDNKDPGARADAAGCRNISLLENIAFVSTPSTGFIMTSVADQILMNSPMHRANIMNPTAITAGMGIAYTSKGWIKVCQEFSSDEI